MNRFLTTAGAAAILFYGVTAYAQTLDGPLAQQQPLPTGRVATAVQVTSNTTPTTVNDDVSILPDQGAARGVVVTDRTPPEYQTLGAPLGSFRFLPEVTVDELYNDNIYATKNHTVDDFTTIIQPRLALRSDWRRNALNFTAASADGIYSDHTSENFDDYLLQADGKLDITRNTRLGGLFSYSGNHEERGSPNGGNLNGVPIQTDPVAFTVRTAQAEAFHQENRVKFDVIYSNQYFNYFNGNTQSGAIVNNGTRNRTDNEVTGRVSYIMTPSYDLYLQGAYNTRDYDNSNAISYYGRKNSDSDGYSVYGGLHADLTGKLFGDIYAGYMEQSYDNSIYSDYSGVGFGVNGYWNATTLDTFTLNVGRDVEETIVAGATNYIETRARLNWDHEMLRNVVISLVAGYDHDDYQGIDRTDNVVVAGGGIKYLINRHFSLFGNYNYINRNSSIDFNDYTQNRFLVGIRAAL